MVHAVGLDGARNGQAEIVNGDCVSTHPIDYIGTAVEGLKKKGSVCRATAGGGVFLQRSDPAGQFVAQNAEGMPTADKTIDRGLQLAVDPTMSQNITVSCRRSASRAGSAVSEGASSC